MSNKPHVHAELIKAWAENPELEFQVLDGGFWRDVVGSPRWNTFKQYRIKPTPLTKPSIDWSAVAKDFKWLARDADGHVSLYSDKPFTHERMWSRIYISDRVVNAHAFASLKAGTCDWKDSLVQRPEGE